MLLETTECPKYQHGFWNSYRASCTDGSTCPLLNAATISFSETSKTSLLFILYIISKIALLVFLSSAHSADFSMHHHVRSYEHSTMIYRLNRKLHFVFRVIFKELQILKRIMDLYCNSLFKLVNFRNLTAHKNTWIGNTFRIRRKAHIHSFSSIKFPRLTILRWHSMLHKHPCSSSIDTIHPVIFQISPVAKPRQIAFASCDLLMACQISLQNISTIQLLILQLFENKEFSQHHFSSVRAC